VDSLKWRLQTVHAYHSACQRAILPPLGTVGTPERECCDFHYLQKLSCDYNVVVKHLSWFAQNENDLMAMRLA